MARLIELTPEQVEALCNGERIQVGPVRLLAECGPPHPVTIMLDEALLAQLLLGGTVTQHGVTLDWDESFNIEERQRLAALIARRGPSAELPTG